MHLALYPGMVRQPAPHGPRLRRVQAHTDGPRRSNHGWVDELEERSVSDEGLGASELWLPAPDPSRVHRAADWARSPSEPCPSDPAQGEGSRWATQELGLTRHQISIPTGAWLVAIEVRTAPHRGIVDLRLRYSAADGSDGFTPWAIGIERGRVHELSCGGVPYAMGVTVRYQPRAGLVNLRVLRAGGSGTDWAVPSIGGELHWAGLRAGAKLSGLEVRAQPGDGIVNIRGLTRGTGTNHSPSPVG